MKLYLLNDHTEHGPHVKLVKYIIENNAHTELRIRRKSNVSVGQNITKNVSSSSSSSYYYLDSLSSVSSILYWLCIDCTIILLGMKWFTVSQKFSHCSLIGANLSNVFLTAFEFQTHKLDKNLNRFWDIVTWNIPFPKIAR